MNALAEDGAAYELALVVADEVGEDLALAPVAAARVVADELPDAELLVTLEEGVRVVLAVDLGDDLQREHRRVFAGLPGLPIVDLGRVSLVALDHVDVGGHDGARVALLVVEELVAADKGGALERGEVGAEELDQEVRRKVVKASLTHIVTHGIDSAPRGGGGRVGGGIRERVERHGGSLPQAADPETSLRSAYSRRSDRTLVTIIET